ncbi:MAG: D-alanine--D-alanine ligase [Planctomycetes bacterium]|nr:D-alanine--D-alanine ligase [Planctomycetota bacterium]
MSSTRRRLLVLCGGTSSERGVSLTSGAGVLEALDRSRWLAHAAVITSSGEVRWTEAPCEHSVVRELEERRMTFRTSSLHAAMDEWRRLGIEVVFLALHGLGGEDGRLQGALEAAGLAYTGSGVAGSALCMDKIWNRAAAADLGVPVSPAVSVLALEWHRDRAAVLRTIEASTGWPCFVKPARGGSSLGLSRAADRIEAERALDLAFAHDGRVLVEAEFRGTEVSCGVLGNAEDEELLVLEPVEIRPRKDPFFSYEEKYSAEGALEHCPAISVPRPMIARIQEAAVRLHRGFALQGMSRTDFLVGPDSFAMLETNTIPGLTPRSLLPLAARVAGISYAELLERIAELGLRARR